MSYLLIFTRVPFVSDFGMYALYGGSSCLIYCFEYNEEKL